MQLTTPIRLAESHYIAGPNVSNYPQLTQSMKSPNISAASGNNSSQKARSDSKQNNQMVQSSTNQIIEFDSIEPIQIQCENCHTFSSSIVHVEYTIYTYVSALLLMLICLCWIPLVLKKYFMKISHSCPGCDRLIGEYDYLGTKLNK
ncbi:unnamed protein product (macronuclear) [Paramecium tetraurelia]|uniref:LITAF domain-containing protein n=1 Tax=Paramecium tetraurelia TaxID=5888 RepID=A0DIW6_PARTE|nr:uncharacterized protein GSPATT00017340001 [Paramecium tetraurelia]CAK82983.1 unnamed protein product [Paramecium tetraurelia]|eukprot:XP_001450380.1 hypothetical protein (macronuclear) [Paramecium tetraurelia strain d4-2]